MGQYCNLGIPADIFKNLFVTASIIYDDDRIKTVMNQVIDIITKFCRRIESRNKNDTFFFIGLLLEMKLKSCIL